MFLVKLVREINMGKAKRKKIRKTEDVMVLITFIWSCTKFLVPKTNGLLLSYKSKKAMGLVMGA